ncbi:hypothetical protein CBS101457_005927 [Exobasidium rhododendri]|nr:hypothetical protein CBS101457_005927 [Exobasidium rhododendri]
MAIDQADYQSRIFAPQFLDNSSSPFNPSYRVTAIDTDQQKQGSAREQHLQQEQQQRRRSDDRAAEGGKKKRLMARGKRGLSIAGGSRNTSKTSSSNTSSTSSRERPIDIIAYGSEAKHRRGSSQTLTLDLEGLDLGRGINSNVTLESMREEGVAYIKGGGGHSSPTAFAAANMIAQSWGRPSADLSRLPDETLMQNSDEDTFFAHLRKCEDSHDILRSDEVLTAKTLAYHKTKVRSQSYHSCGEDSKQVLGGFASLGYDENMVNSRNNNLYATDQDTDACGSDSQATSSQHLSSSSKEPTNWRTLVPILHDPMETLDILSIEEMGLHSIDVGSSEDWEGVTLSYPCHLSEDEDSTKKGCEQVGVPAQWAVARSMKRQRKWIVTPMCFSSSRTVVISDHVSTQQQQQQQSQPRKLNSASTPFSLKSTFELRFLQAGTSAPGYTILLASPATHRMLAAKKVNAAKGSVSSESGDPQLTSLGIQEEQKERSFSSSGTGAFHLTGSGTMMKGGEDKWPTMRSKASKAMMMNTRRDARPSTLCHSKSSSTINAATVAMIHLESRRPSLGKSISHDSLIFTGLSTSASSTTPTATAPSTPSQSRSLSPRAPSQRLHYPHPSCPSTKQSSKNFESQDILPQSSVPTHLPSESYRPFGDSSFHFKDSLVKQSSPLHQTQLGLPPITSLSPRTSMIESSCAGGGVLAEDTLGKDHGPSDDASKPVLWSIDPTRLADYRRLQLANDEKINGSVEGNLNRWNTAWQAGGNGGGGLSPPPGGSIAAKSMMKSKDRRLSDWIKKKVKPGQVNSSTAVPCPPLPPAWEQKRDSHSNQELALTRSMTNTVRARPRDIGSSDVMSHTIPDPTTPSSFPLTASKSEERDPAKKVIAAAITSRAYTARSSPRNVQSSQGTSVWPGVASPPPSSSSSSNIGSRRRSNSDNNFTLLNDVEKRRLEVLGSKDKRTYRKGRLTSLRDNGKNSCESAEESFMMELSTSMPTHSFMNHSVFHDHAAPTQRSNSFPTTTTAMKSVDLLGMEDALSHSITMIIPLPLSKNAQDIPIRYLRVAFTPFAGDANSIQEDDRISSEMNAMSPTSLNPSRPGQGGGGGTSSTWYKKLTHAWTSNTSARSSSIDSTGEQAEDDARGGEGRRSEEEDKFVKNANDTKWKRNSTVESFRISVKVLENPAYTVASSAYSSQTLCKSPSSTSQERTFTPSQLPCVTPFPVILGVCDNQRSLKLIPEGWQAIGLASGPAKADSNGPLEGLADLIIAGCAACMDL